MRKFLITFTTVITAVIMAFSMAACSPSESDGEVEITLNTQSVNIQEGGASATVVATVTGSTEYVTWTIEDESVATIIPTNNICIVRPVEEGTTTLTASIGEVSVDCPVTVGPPEEVETVTIFYNGTDVATLTDPLTVERDNTLTLTATASLGSDISWMSSNEAVATVEDGVVTALRPGTVTITAYVTASIRATVEIIVTAPEDSVYYDLLRAAEGDTVDMDYGEPITYDIYFYWSARSEWGQQQVDVDYAYYEDGVIYFSYTSDWDPGYSYGFQLFYKNSQHTIGNNYSLTCTITVDQDCFVTLNGTVLELKEGENEVTVYYQYTDGLGSGNTYGISSFDLVMGYDDGTATGYFVKDAVVSVSDISWAEDVPVQLAAPSFTYNEETGVIDITDPNEDGVAGYLLYFYNEDGVVNGTITVEDGGVVDTSTIANGTYTVRLTAIGANAHYLESQFSESTATIVVENEGGPSYTLEGTGAAGATASPGTWTYWTESWVEFTGNYSNGIVTVEFSNNAGNWYDTQLFYRHPGAEQGATYEVTLNITSSAAGRVTIEGQVVTLEAGTHEYTVTVVQGSAQTFQIVFGVLDENNNQDIKSGTVSIEIVSIVKTADSSTTPEEPGGETVVGDPVSVTLTDGEVNFGEESVATSAPGTVVYWNNQGWVDGNYVTVSNAKIEDGELTLTYSGAVSNIWYGMQLFYKNAANVEGTTYTLTLNINASVAGNITINGQKVELVAGDNAISVVYTEGSGASISIQFGVEADATVISEGTFTISDIAFAAHSVV